MSHEGGSWCLYIDTVHDGTRRIQDKGTKRWTAYIDKLQQNHLTLGAESVYRPRVVQYHLGAAVLSRGTLAGRRPQLSITHHSIMEFEVLHRCR